MAFAFPPLERLDSGVCEVCPGDTARHKSDGPDGCYWVYSACQACGLFVQSLHPADDDERIVYHREWR